MISKHGVGRVLSWQVIRADDPQADGHPQRLWSITPHYFNSLKPHALANQGCSFLNPISSRFSLSKSLPGTKKKKKKHESKTFFLNEIC